MNPTAIPLRAQLLRVRLPSGRALLIPVADPRHALVHEDADALLEAQLFLSEWLRTQAPSVVARFVANPDARVELVPVALTREDLPRRFRDPVTAGVTCVVLPDGARSWVLVAPLGTVVHVAPGESVAETVGAEVALLVDAWELSPARRLELFPYADSELVHVDLLVERRQGAGAPGERAGDLARAEEKTAALEALRSVATALHDQDAPVSLSHRDDALRMLSALLDGAQRQSVLLTGPSLVGKSVLLRAWIAQRKAEGRSPLVFLTSGAQLLAGMSGLGQWEERLRKLLDAAELLDAVLVFDNLGELLTDRPTGGVNLPAALRPALEEGRVRLVGELRDELVDAADRHHGGFLGNFTRVRLDALSASQTLDALREGITLDARSRPDRAALTPEGAETLVELATRYMAYDAFPGKAFRLLDELRAVVESDRDLSRADAPTMDRELVQRAFSRQSGIPPFILRDDLAMGVEEVTATLQGRLVGQLAAVRAVAQTLGVVKAGMQRGGRPLACLLFVGPTGVGKTELARAAAHLLYGSDERMIRFDMSEYTDLEAADRLIRGTHGAEGLLTRRIREQPFGVLLLDEVEKAHPAVFDLLLQVLGEGRLTDGRGRTAYFHNAIIVMTSNLGATGAREPVGIAAAPLDLAAHYLRAVERSFRPEFINRLDRVVPFDALGPAEVRAVAAMAVAKLGVRRGLHGSEATLSVTDRALDHLAAQGYSHRYGARAMRRHLEDHLVAPLSRVLDDRLDPGAALSAVRVSVPDEVPETRAPGQRTEETVDGLRFELWSAARRLRAEMSELQGVLAAHRRWVDAAMQLPRVDAIRSQLEHLRAQLSYRASAAGAASARGEVTALQREHHRLDAHWTALTTLQRELWTLEELALDPAVDRDGARGLRDDARAVRERYEAALAWAILSSVTGRNAAVLLVSEIDDTRGLERWLAALDELATARRWTVDAHLQGMVAQREDEWPADRRWGPPRRLRAVLDLLRDEGERDARSVLLLVEGVDAGVLLALEAGVHLWREGSVRSAIELRLLTRSDSIGEKQWSHPSLVPPKPTEFEAHQKRSPARLVLAGERVMVPGGRSVALEGRHPLAIIERVACQHLVALELDEGAPPLEELMEGPLDSEE
ncbi:MAG: ATP-dependent Clp protease ATP-binding subunit [Deltaproteobacteria bacterium]|nr:ATP-dependent Clp protease ATP-binding subunit [Deltaproteobacteria bacterium]